MGRTDSAAWCCVGAGPRPGEAASVAPSPKRSAADVGVPAGRENYDEDGDGDVGIGTAAAAAAVDVAVFVFVVVVVVHEN